MGNACMHACAAGPAEEPAESLEDVAEESREWAAAFAQLHNAAAPEPEPLPGVPDARQNLAAQLARLSQARGRVLSSRMHVHARMHARMHVTAQ